MKIEFATFIVMSENSYRTLDPHAGEEIDFTTEDRKIYDLDKPVPIIVKGVDCVGLAKVRSFTVFDDRTTVTFEFNTISKQTGAAAYKLWTNENAFNDSEIYGDEAVPGVYRSRTADLNKPSKPKRKDRDIPDFLK